MQKFIHLTTLGSLFFSILFFSACGVTESFEPVVPPPTNGPLTSASSPDLFRETDLPTESSSSIETVLKALDAWPHEGFRVQGLYRLGSAFEQDGKLVRILSNLTSVSYLDTVLSRTSGKENCVEANSNSPIGFRFIELDPVSALQLNNEQLRDEYQIEVWVQPISGLNWGDVLEPSQIEVDVTVF